MQEHLDLSKVYGKFEEILTENGLRRSKSRQALLDLMLAQSDHFSAEQLYVQSKSQNIRTSKATIYRLLKLLSKHNILEQHDFGQSETYYEPIYGRKHHDHLVCLGCGKIIEFSSDAIEELQDFITQIHNFKQVSHTHKIFGFCKNCQKNLKKDTAGPE